MHRYLENPNLFWQEENAGGRWRPAGFLCPYLPEEIMEAAGLTPLRILPLKKPSEAVDRHLPPNTCSVARSMLSQALDGSLAGMAGVFFAHSCDTMQCLSDIWRVNRPDGLTYNLVGPVALQAAGAKEYLLAELALFVKFLEEKLQVEVTEDDLWSAIGLHNKTRQLLAKLEQNRESYTAMQYFALLEASVRLPKEIYNTLLEDELKRENIYIPGTGPRLLLAGAVLTDPAIPGVIEEAGGRVVADTLCSGTRYFDMPVPVDRTGGPLPALATRYLERPPCPARHPEKGLIGRQLLALAADRKVDGVIFLLDPFCDPHAFEVVATAAVLKNAGLPSLEVQVDHSGVTGQLKTRIQAFVELLRGGER